VSVEVHRVGARRPGARSAKRLVGHSPMSWECLTWIWTYPSRRRGDILKRLAAFNQRKHVAILRSAAAIEEFIAKAPRGGAPSHTCDHGD
jgi:hypothetical protein